MGDGIDGDLSSGPHLKQLKSTVSGLRRLFDDRVTARYLAEPFVALDGMADALEVRRFMDQRDFDVIGVRRFGVVVGFADRNDLSAGYLSDHLRPFEMRQLVDESVSVIDVLNRLAEVPGVCVEVMGQVSGIITRGDLQKAPVRMWLFALLSLLEMHFLRLLRSHHEDADWAGLIPTESYRKARRALDRRRKRNEEIDLIDCTYFSDKVSAIAKTAPLRAALGFESEDATMEVLNELTRLRNDLAHGHDIVRQGAADLATIARRTEELLRLCEDVA